MDTTSALKVVGIPSYVKVAAVEQYDFDSREATYLSAVRALVKNASEEQLREVDGYARFWNITQDVVSAREKWAAYNDLPEPTDADYALSVEYGDQRVQKFAAYDSGSTATAARAFCDGRARLPYEWRKTAAVNILARAQAFDAQLPEYAERALQKSAGFGIPTPEALRLAVSQRAELVHQRFQPELDELSKLASTLIDNEPARYDLDLVKEAISAIEGFDRQTGICTHYQTGRLGLPEEIIDDYSVLSVVEKTATYTPSSVTLVNQQIIDLQGLDKQALAMIDPDLMGLSDERLADVLPTLPREDADLLVRLVG